MVAGGRGSRGITTICRSKAHTFLTSAAAASAGSALTVAMSPFRQPDRCKSPAIASGVLTRGEVSHAADAGPAATTESVSAAGKENAMRTALYLSPPAPSGTTIKPAREASIAACAAATSTSASAEVMSKCPWFNGAPPRRPVTPRAARGGPRAEPPLVGGFPRHRLHPTRLDGRKRPATAC